MEEQSLPVAALTLAGADAGRFDLTSAERVPCGPSWAVRQEHLPASTELLGLIAAGNTEKSTVPQFYRHPLCLLTVSARVWTELSITHTSHGAG